MAGLSRVLLQDADAWHPISVKRDEKREREQEEGNFRNVCSAIHNKALRHREFDDEVRTTFAKLQLHRSRYKSLYTRPTQRVTTKVNQKRRNLSQWWSARLPVVCRPIFVSVHYRCCPQSVGSRKPSQSIYQQSYLIDLSVQYRLSDFFFTRFLRNTELRDMIHRRRSNKCLHWEPIF